jgi:hypothetical protein
MAFPTNVFQSTNYFVDPIFVPANEAVAVDDLAATQVNTSVTINVLANDTAPSGMQLVVTGVQSPTQQGGTAVVAQDQRSINYTPPTSFTGEDVFTYEVAAQ